MLETRCWVRLRFYVSYVILHNGVNKNCNVIRAPFSVISYFHVVKNHTLILQTSLRYSLSVTSFKSISLTPPQKAERERESELNEAVLHLTISCSKPLYSNALISFAAFLLCIVVDGNATYTQNWKNIYLERRFRPPANISANSPTTKKMPSMPAMFSVFLSYLMAIPSPGGIPNLSSAIRIRSSRSSMFWSANLNFPLKIRWPWTILKLFSLTADYWFIKNQVSSTL